MNNLLIDCRKLSKKFRWYERNDMLKSTVANLGKGPRQIWEWYVLKDIDLKIRKGERVGVIGRNGCGKTTLLKLLVGIYSPTSGDIGIFSKRMLAIIELGAGFYPDLTGRENIKLNWLFNALHRHELKQCFDEIVEFAGVEHFLDTPLKYYSSGMAARLGFSILAHAKPELLIVDEVLAVGDIEFQQRCYEKMDELCRNGVSLILVSHNAADIRRVCERVVWLDDGTIRSDGEVNQTLDMYENAVIA